MAKVPSTRLGVIFIFFFVVLLIALGQIIYFIPRGKEMKGGGTVFSLQQEVVHLRLENAELKDHDIQREEKMKELQDNDARLEREAQDRNKQVEKYKEDYSLLQQKVEELQKQVESSSSSSPSSPSSSFSSSSLDKAILDLITPPNNVVTHKDTLVYLLKNFNTYGEIRNRDKFKLEDNFIPIVVRVYNKHEYFGYALEHYRQVKDINKTMLIVSHDGIFPEMFSLVQSIDFCQVKQIIHPYSGHLLMNRFPGPDSTIPDTRDQYGNPRPFPYSSLKHHYWWHMNFVWDSFLAGHQGNMMFMEEDHVPTDDYYLTAKALARIRDEKCPTCYNAKIHQHKHTVTSVHKVFLSYDLGNVGMIIKREVWEKIKLAGRDFCTFDDYNWDWTMAYMSTIGSIPQLSLTAAYPRAEHLGKCGTHSNSGECSINDEDKKHFEEVNEKLKKEHGEDWSNYDFNPTPVDTKPDHRKGWGGWAHPMDHEHCMNQIKKAT